MADLIYLHGFSSGPGGHKGRFTRAWAEGKGLAFHAPDLNLPTFQTLTLTAQVGAVEALVRSLPEPPVLVGSSLGGFVATAVAHRGLPVAALILLAPAIHFAKRRAAGPEWAAYRAQGWMMCHHHILGRPLRLGPELLEDMARWADDDTWRIPVPATLIHGTRDEAVPLAESEAYAARNPEARLCVVDDDHGLLSPVSMGLLQGSLEAAFRAG